jgi:hypothetical protein
LTFMDNISLFNVTTQFRQFSFTLFVHLNEFRNDK